MRDRWSDTCNWGGWFNENEGENYYVFIYFFTFFPAVHPRLEYFSYFLPSHHALKFRWSKGKIVEDSSGKIQERCNCSVFTLTFSKTWHIQLFLINTDLAPYSLILSQFSLPLRGPVFSKIRRSAFAHQFFLDAIPNSPLVSPNCNLSREGACL